MSFIAMPFEEDMIASARVAEIEGDPMGSRVWMSDFDWIDDLRGLTRQELVTKLVHLGREAAHTIRPFVMPAGTKAPSRTRSGFTGSPAKLV